MDLDQHHCQQRPGLKIVCEACGSLAIKAIVLAGEPELTKIHCRRCNAVRGTLADLHDLARRSADVFEF
ncbi:MAG: hypothetical protein E8A46_22530 [Bradyrhizobium sp.]|jgi:hypothetical protein|uniref:hypothetical protein n=1 Tax=Bradyrhizobium sp. TaxID=376 RepID=UPI00121F3C50|nr:hypothetical protein [Bradyrhizobium sp.]THD48307.1 MAG: hypothetical protein E8A46_22530 [Bradyrhizobium sp.]